MTEQYRCTSCGLVGAAGGDPLTGGDGPLAWVNYYLCANCGTGHSLLIGEDSAVLLTQPGPILGQPDFLAHAEPWEPVEYAGAGVPDPEHVPCQYCGATAALIERLADILQGCPHCGQETFVPLDSLPR